MNLSNIRMVVTDMDGSLLNENHEINEPFWQLFKALRELDIEFVAASGRQYASMLSKLAPIKDDMTFVAENGAIVCRNDKTLLATELTRTDVEKVVSAINVVTPHIVLCSRDMAYVLGYSNDFFKIVREFYTETKLIQDLDEVDAEIVKIAIYHPEEAEHAIYPYVKRFEGELLVKISGANWVDLSHPDANKGYAISSLLDKHNIAPNALLVFGDYHNDIEMLKLATYSVAMANAHTDVKAVANYETLSHQEMGVEHILKKLVVQKMAQVKPDKRSSCHF